MKLVSQQVLLSDGDDDVKVVELRLVFFTVSGSMCIFCMN